MRSLTFTTLFCVALLAPLALFVLEVPFGIVLPAKASSQEAHHLSGDLAALQNEQTPLSLSDIRSGAFQSAVEIEIGRHIPFKSSALLGNAFWQRTMIGMSDVLFGYRCYPAYYGSSRLWLSEWNAASEQPLKQIDALRDSITEFASGLERIARQYPSISFHVLVVDQPATVSGNPAHDLLGGNTITTEAVYQQLTDDCQEPNITVNTNAHENLESYYADYMKGDHHWNIQGAVEAASILLEDAGLPGIDDPTFIPVGDIGYSGYTARAALADIVDAPFDAQIDYSPLSIIDGDAILDGNDHSKYWNLSDEEKYWQFYESYWPYDTHFEGPGNDAALMICDSAGNSIARMIALQYSALYVDHDLHSNTHDAQPLSELIESYRPVDVYIVSIPNDILDFCTRNPQYFD